MTSVRSSFVPSAAALLIFALPATMSGQARAAATRDTVPLSLLPPAGKCRIWMDGVPAAQQPAPTDCATALRQRPANGTILYGPAARETSGGRFDPNVGDRGSSRSAKPGDAIERGGSEAEMELKRQRDRAERDRRAAELRERDERARREASDRASLIFGNDARRGTPSSPASARTAGGSTTGSEGTTKAPAERTAKPPAEPAKKKPE
jgi:hypothetical protein